MKRYSTIIVLIIAFISIIFFFRKNNRTTIQQENKEVVNNQKEYSHKVKNGNELTFKNGYGSFKLYKKAKEEQTYYFKNTSCNEVAIELVPATDTANIRINTIISPNKEMDGPFGRNLVYGLLEKGLYKIVIGESLMKGYPYEGNYTLNLRLK